MNNEKIIKLPKQVEEMKTQMETIADYTKNKIIYVRNFKTLTNTFEDAIEDAMEYGKQFIISQPENGGSYITSNPIIKVDKGRYVINREFTVPQKGFDFDFTGCTFVTNTNVNFMNAISKFWVTKIEGGSFVGFNTVFKFSTTNADGARVIFNNQVFSKCKVCIDSNSYESSRSTFLKVRDFEALDCENFIKAHTDMCVLDGGWINHLGGDYASIVNMGFMSIKDIVFVPYAPTQNSNSRWIENYHSPDGGDRKLKIEGCRFGGEFGGLNYVIVNYADNFYYNRIMTRIVIDDCMLYAKKSLILLNKIPNLISIKNSNGNGFQYCIDSVDSLDLSSLSPEQVSIDIDNTFRGVNQSSGVQKLFKNDILYKLVRKNFMDSNRFSNYTGVPHKPLPFTKGTKTIKITGMFSAYPGTTGGASYSNSVKNIGFMLSSSDIISGNSAYNSNSLYYINVGSGHNGTTVTTRLFFNKISNSNGGMNYAKFIEIESVTFNDSGLNEIATSLVNNTTEITITFKDNLDSANINIIPFVGTPINTVF